MFNKINNFININLYDFNKYINNLLLILKLFINIFTIVFTLFFTSVLYISIDIKMFVLLIFLILILSNFIIYYKYNILTVYNKYIVIILNKDYSFLLKKIVMIKFILLYLYVVEDVSWCDSSFTRIAHDIFMSMGTKVGMEPKTTVSTLETIGMFTICGGIAYGSIKGYQHFTGTGPKSINERLDLMERNMNRNNIEIYSKFTELKEQVDDTRINLINTVADYQRENIEHFTHMGNALIDVNTKIDVIDNKVTNLTEVIATNQTQINTIIKEEFRSQLNKIDELQQRQRDVINRNIDNLTESDKIILTQVYGDFESILKKSDEVTERLPQHLSSALSILEPSYKPFTLNTYRTNSLKNIEKIANKRKNELHRSNSLDLDNLPTTPSTSIVSSLPINKSFKISEITDTKIVFTSIGSSVTDLTTGLINNASKHIFNLPINDYVIKIIYNGLGQVLSNTLSGIAFAEILKLLNIGSNIPTITTSQNVGSVLSSTLREFVNGLKQGWRK